MSRQTSDPSTDWRRQVSTCYGLGYGIVFLGETTFDVEGMAPREQLRVLIIQAENDEGDLAEPFQDIIKASEMTGDDIQRIRERLTIIENDTDCGNDFCKLLTEGCETYKPDVVWIDPLMAYAGGDVLSQANMTKFLRNIVQPIVTKNQILLGWVHHVGKPSGDANGHEKSDEQKKYSGLGTSDMQNVWREVINMSDQGDGLYELKFSKRGNRLGLKDEEGRITKTLNIEHSDNAIIWRQAQGDRVHVKSKTGAKAVRAKEATKMYIKSKSIVTQFELEQWAAMHDISQRSAVVAANILVEGCRGISNEFLKFYKYKRPAPFINGKKIPGEQPTIFTTIAPELYEKSTGADAENEKCVS